MYVVICTASGDRAESPDEDGILLGAATLVDDYERAVGFTQGSVKHARDSLLVSAGENTLQYHYALTQLARAGRRTR